MNKYRFALLDMEGSSVMSITEWDGVSAWVTPYNQRVVMLPENSPVRSGWKWIEETNSFLPTVGTEPEDPTIRKLPKIDFMRLFTNDEMVLYKLLRMRIKNLTEADYTAAIGGDEAKMMLVSADVFFDRFDLASEVEMDHPETIVAVNILAMAGIIEADRIPDVLAGRLPNAVDNEIPVDEEEPVEGETPGDDTPV